MNNVPNGGVLGGLTPWRNLDLGNTGQVVKGAAGKLHFYFIGNQTGAVAYVKFYDKATAATAGDTPKFTLPIPAGGGANVALPIGIVFAAGISVRATTGVGDADTASPAANGVIVNLGYE